MIDQELVAEIQHVISITTSSWPIYEQKGREKILPINYSLQIIHSAQTACSLHSITVTLPELVILPGGEEAGI